MSDESDSSYTDKTLKKKLVSPTFLINRSGIPVNKETWERLWTFYCGRNKELRKECEEKARSGCRTRYPPLPFLISANKTNPSLNEIVYFMGAIRDYFNALQYNHVGTQLFDISKSSGFSRLMDKAKFMIRCSLPIKCLEAVVIAMYLTSFIPKLVRFPITFKSVSNGQAFYHIVLGLQFKGQFGAIGFSRRIDLMDKPLRYNNLSTLIKDYKECYENYSHKLVKVKIGGPVPSDLCSQANVTWCHQKFSINSRLDWAVVNRVPRIFKDSSFSTTSPPNYETIMSMVQLTSSISRSSNYNNNSRSKQPKQHKSATKKKSSKEQLAPKLRSSTSRVLNRPQLLTSNRLKIKSNPSLTRRKA